MKILIAGGNGLIGARVVTYLRDLGHEIVRLVRRIPNEKEIRWNPDAGRIDRDKLEGFDAVVHLASMPWPPLWTASVKRQLMANRLNTNGLLAETLANLKHKPRVLICASGMGIYPSSADRFLTEASTIGTDFLATLQSRGEEVAMKACVAGIRVVNLRIPAVLERSGLRRGRNIIGDGKQWNSWISRDELARIIDFVLKNESLEGPINPVSPNPIRNAVYVETLSRVLKRKPGPPIPAFILQCFFTEMADALILASRRILPCKLLEAGYQFQYGDLKSALQHELRSIHSAAR